MSHVHVDDCFILRDEWPISNRFQFTASSEVSRIYVTLGEFHAPMENKMRRIIRNQVLREICFYIFCSGSGDRNSKLRCTARSSYPVRSIQDIFCYMNRRTERKTTERRCEWIRGRQAQLGTWPTARRVARRKSSATVPGLSLIVCCRLPAPADSFSHY